MLPIHWRLAELWTKQKSGALTNAEAEEMSLCLQANANFARKLANLYNLSLMASMTSDWDWQHDICEKIDRLETEYQHKKPASLKKTDPE
jgi:hypothetical protein